MEQKNDIKNFVLNVAVFQSQKVIASLIDPEEYLFNIVASCLLNEVRYYDDQDSRRLLLLLALNKVAETSPEFVLQLALYLRNELYVRTTTNFIVAFAAYHANTRRLLAKYFSKTVLLPNDLIEVCQFAQLMNFLKKNENIVIVQNGQNENFSLKQYKETDFRKKLHFPKSLMKCIQAKFQEFNVYQLGKYCSENNRKQMLFKYLQAKDFEQFTQKKLQIKERIKKRILQKALKLKGIGLNQEKQDKIVDETDQKKSKEKQKVPSISKKSKLIQKFQQKHQKHQKAKVLEQKNFTDVKSISMKDIISLCHVKTPQFLVKSVLGKKYPETEEQFDQEFKQEKQQLKLKFDPMLAKKRMKIQTPVTWETEISSKGNKPEVWTELIMSNKLPYMAMMRNLRNILKSGVSDVVHHKIMDKICDPVSVAHAKMFPFQYFSAMEAINEILSGEKPAYEGMGLFRGNKMRGGRGSRFVRRGGRGSYGKFQNFQMKNEDDNEEEQKIGEGQKVNKDYANQYIKCINQALNIAVEKNLDEIAGHTVIFADVSGSMRTPISGNAKKYGSVRECYEVGLLLGLMIRKKCKQCSFYIFSSPNNDSKCYLKVNLEDDDYLTNMQILSAEADNLGGGTDFPVEVIHELKQKKIKIDNIVILSDMMISDGHSDIGNAQHNLRDYLMHVNPDLKIFSVDLRGYGQQIQLTDEFNEKNYIRIFGMSDNILRFISIKERNQIAEIKSFAEAFLAKKD